jgi:hypothetical protein
MWVQRVCTMPMPGSAKWWITFMSQSVGGVKSASKMATNSPLAELSPLSERSRLVAVRSVRWMIGDVVPRAAIALDDLLGHFRRSRRWNRRAPGCRAFRRGIRSCRSASTRRSTTNCSLKIGNWMVTRGRIGEAARRFNRTILSVLVIQVNQHITVHTVRSQKDKHDEVRDQQRHVKSIGVIKALEGRVEKMLPNVLAEASRGHESG